MPLNPTAQQSVVLGQETLVSDGTATGYRAWIVHDPDLGVVAPATVLPTKDGPIPINTVPARARTTNLPGRARRLWPGLGPSRRIRPIEDIVLHARRRAKVAALPFPVTHGCR
jgi:hypothetical protein